MFGGPEVADLTFSFFGFWTVLIVHAGFKFI